MNPGSFFSEVSSSWPRSALASAVAPELEKKPEPLRVRQPLDVVDEVRVDAGAVLLQGQQVLAGARLAVFDDFQRRSRDLGAGGRVRS